MIIAITIVILGFIILSVIVSKQDVKRDVEEKADGVLYAEHFIRYLGGFPEISGDEHTRADVKVKRDKMIVDIISQKKIKEIPMTNILDAQCSTTEQVIQDVSLGRLIVFGFYGLAMKKKKKEIIKCAIITFNDEFNKERSIVFQIDFPDKLIQTILDLKRELQAV